MDTSAVRSRICANPCAALIGEWNQCQNSARPAESAGINERRSWRPLFGPLVHNAQIVLRQIGYNGDVNRHADGTPIHTQGRGHKTEDTARLLCGWQRYAGSSTKAFGDCCSVFLSTRRVRLPRQVKQKWCKVCRLSGEKPVGNETVYGPHCI